VALTRRLAVAVATALPLSAAQAPSPLSGVYEAVRMNAQPLPVTDRVRGDDGRLHAVRLSQMVIRFRPGARFVASVKYQRAILSRGERVESQPLLAETWSGAYVRRAAAIEFRPDRTGPRSPRPFQGTVRAGGRITVPFDYDNGGRRRYTLELARNAALW
jgi:hypothetical protein